MKPIDGRNDTQPSVPKARRIRWLTRSAPLLLPVATMLMAPSDAAFAACLQSGNDVTCSGTINTGFGTGAENNLAVTVQPDASIDAGAAQTAINLGNGNTATNNGAIAVGAGGLGMEGLDNNSFTNNGKITVGARAAP